MQGRALIVSAPSGSGKTTILNRLRAVFPSLAFSVSATSRSPRPGEKDGADYYFLSREEFLTRRERGDFLEWEEVYGGTLYGTVRADVEGLWQQGKVVLFDVDVKGGLRLKELLGDGALTLFIAPPSIEELCRRLELRGTETPESLAKRLARAEMEMGLSPRYDAIVVNDDLETAVREAEQILRAFLNS